MTAIEQLEARQGLVKFLEQQTNPGKFISPNRLTHFNRAPCDKQVFTSFEVARLFIQFMKDKGLWGGSPEKCGRCGKVHVLREG
jgi:hypothetical protein